MLEAIGQNDTTALSLNAAGMIAIAIVTGVLGVIQTLLSNQVGQRVMHDLRAAVFRHLQRLSLAFFTRTRTGEVQSRISNDIGGVQNVVTNTATSIASNVTTVVATMVGMLVLSWQLALFAFALIPLFVLLTRRVGNERRRIAKTTQETLADISSLVQESLSVSGILLGKTMGRGDELADRFEADSLRLADLEVRQRMAGRWVMASIQTSFAIMPAAVYWFGGLALAHGSHCDLDPDARGLHDAADAALLPGRLAARRRPRRADVARALRPDLRVPRPADRHRGEAGRARRRAGRRRRLRPRLVPLRRGLDAPGRLVHGRRRARRPRSSARPAPARRRSATSRRGSTTSAAGRITIGGVDIRDLSFQALSDLVGVVSQETYLFHESVRENLRFAKPDATDEEIEAAAEAARIHHVIAALPEGYDTVVGERGYRFSGGEKQRIAIARTILRNPPILVLDEATSSLDTETERLVQEALDRLSEGRTTIAIAHRLSTVRDADQIIVLDHGRVVESGRHEDLIRRGRPLHGAHCTRSRARPWSPGPDRGLRTRAVDLMAGGDRMDLVIAVDDPGADDVRALLERHLAFAREVTPPGHVHALDADGLMDPAITLFSARQRRCLARSRGAQPAGRGARRAEVDAHERGRERPRSGAGDGRPHSCLRSRAELHAGESRDRRHGCLCACSIALLEAGLCPVRALRRLLGQSPQRLHDHRPQLRTWIWSPSCREIAVSRPLARIVSGPPSGSARTSSTG